MIFFEFQRASPQAIHNIQVSPRVAFFPPLSRGAKENQGNPPLL
jgi:hypothetical protein